MAALNAGYYASYDSSVPGPSPVTGWYDTLKFTYTNMPPAENLIQITQAQWKARLSGYWAVSNGTLIEVNYTLPLSVQAGAALSKLSSSATGTIENGVPVSVGGQSYTISSDKTSQLNLLANATVTLGAMMTAVNWSAGASVAPLTVVKVGTNYLITNTGGTTGTNAPAVPSTYGVGVSDNTVTWKLFGVLVAIEPHGTIWMSPDEFFSAYGQFNNYLTAVRQQYHTLAGALHQPDITEAQVQSAEWPVNIENILESSLSIAGPSGQ